MHKGNCLLVWKRCLYHRLLEKLSRKVIIPFFINDSKVDVNKVVTINLKEATLDQILRSLFSETDYTYQVIDKQIMVKLKGDTVVANQRKVTGIVKDVTGEPLVGVTVIVEGTQIATVTGMNGDYSIEIPNDNVMLRFSYVGYAPQSVSVKSKSSVNITLREDTELLDEVVIVGYGTQKKSNVTGSVASVKASDYNDLNMDVTSVLQGRVAGVDVSNGSIIIRGAASVNGSEPLWIVDGVPGRSS